MRPTPLLTLLGSGVFLFSSCDINMTATSTPLPVRNAVLNLSQSNGTTVADAKGFEDANPQIAIRSPSAVASGVRFNQGSRSETITMPDPPAPLGPPAFPSQPTAPPPPPVFTPPGAPVKHVAEPSPPP